MYQKLYSNSTLWRTLFENDQLSAEEVHRQPCPRPDCGGKMNWNNYVRKPRGGPEHPEFSKYFGYRMSLCCGRCRKRQTPESVRFLGRKIYIGLTLLVASSRNEGCQSETDPPTEKPQMVSPVDSISTRTLGRWVMWWTQSFFKSSFWRGSQGLFATSIDMSAPVSSLISKFVNSSMSETIVTILNFLAPITKTVEYINVLYAR
jgi:hypothetical protein